MGGLSGLFGGGGSKKAARAIRAQSDMLERMYRQQRADFEPFRKIGLEGHQIALDEAKIGLQETEIGLGARQDLQGLLTDQGQGQFLENYFQSQPFQQMSQAAGLQQEAAAESTGNFGSSSLMNSIGAIAPTLGFQALGQRIGGLGSLAGLNSITGQSTGVAGLGLGAASGTAQAGANFGAQSSQAVNSLAQLYNNESSGALGGLGTLAGLFAGQGVGAGAQSQKLGKLF